MTDAPKAEMAELAWAGYLSYLHAEGLLEGEDIGQIKREFMQGFNGNGEDE